MVPAPSKKDAPARRSRRRLTVRYGTEKPGHIGYSGNISGTGMMIRTTRVFVPGTVIRIEVELLARTLGLKGQVVRARTGEIRWLPTGKIGMGIKFIQPPENLMDIIFPITVSG